MRFDKATRNGQSQTEPPGFAAVAAIEFFENALGQFGGKSRPSVADRYDETAVVAIGVDLDRQLCRAVTSGVSEQLGDSLFHEEMIDQRQRCVFRDIQPDIAAV